MLTLAVLCTFSTAHADTYVPVGSSVYDDLRKFEAEGAVTTAMLGTLPLSRREIARLVSEAMSNEASLASPYLRSLLLRLEKDFAGELHGGGQVYLQPLEEVSVEYQYSDDTSALAQKNRSGRIVDSGSTVFAEATAHLNSPYLGLVATPLVRWDEQGISARFARAYALATLGREEFFVGKEDNWWGPGRNGTLALSNNAAPVTMLKVSNSTPYELLGTQVRGTFFISRLEEDRRDVSEPIYYGLRLNLKPSRFLEVGLTKVAFFGGKGREETLSVFLDSLTGKGENADDASQTEPGDQKAGFDFTLTVPWKVQPFSVYGEYVGEDEAGDLPSRIAWIAGVYLPRVLGLERLELLAEYASTDIGGHPDYWYNHHIYTAGYTFKGRIMGHYIGSDAKDLFLRARYNFDRTAVALSHERLIKDFPSRTVWQDFGVEMTSRLFADGELKISGHYSQEDIDILRVGAMIRYFF